MKNDTKYDLKNENNFWKFTANSWENLKKKVFVLDNFCEILKKFEGSKFKIELKFNLQALIWKLQKF